MAKEQLSFDLGAEEAAQALFDRLREIRNGDAKSGDAVAAVVAAFRERDRAILDWLGSHYDGGSQAPLRSIEMKAKSEERTSAPARGFVE